MGYKVLACDLDDTLLDDFGTISYKNKAAIDEMTVKGLKFVIVTGRTYKSALPFYKELGLKTPIITSGGTQVFDHNGKMIYHDLLPAEKTHEILLYAKERGLHAQVYMGEDFQYLQNCEEAEYYAKYTGLTGVEDKNLLLKEIHTSKVVIITDKEKAPYEIELLKAAFPELRILRSKGRLIELYTRNASKGNALKNTVKLMGYHKSDVAAAGDSTIDLSMLEYAALSAAPENSLLEVKTKVDVILKSNNDHAIDQLIREYIL